MRKLLFSMIFILTIVLSGCGKNEAVETVKEMYTAAIEGDADTFTGIHLPSQDVYSIENVMAEYGGYALDMGGVGKMKFSPVASEEELLPDVVTDLKEDYDDNWELVLEERTEGDNYNVYILQKSDEKYYIADEAISVDREELFQ